MKKFVLVVFITMQFNILCSMSANNVDYQFIVDQAKIDRTVKVILALCSLRRDATELYWQLERYANPKIWDPTGKFHEKTKNEDSLQVIHIESLYRQINCTKAVLSKSLDCEIYWNVFDIDGIPMLYLIAGADLHNTIMGDSLLENVCTKAIQNGCDPNYQDPETGVSALHVAVQRGNLRIVKTLLRLGASPLLRDVHGRTPLDVTTNKLIQQTIVQHLGMLIGSREVPMAVCIESHSDDEDIVADESIAP